MFYFFFLQKLADESLRRENARLREQIADKESELEQQRRVNDVLQAENETQAAVIVRDRSRVQAEHADFVRRREFGEQ